MVIGEKASRQVLSELLRQPNSKMKDLDIGVIRGERDSG